MQILVDTCILARSLDAAHPDRTSAATAVRKLMDQGNELILVPQVIYEWWVVATRPTSANGLGLTVDAAAAVIESLDASFRIIPDGANLLAEWRTLVVQHAVVVKKAHDARIAAAMRIHGVTNLLTFNLQDFARYSFISTLSPAAIAESSG